jgi:predicted transcriptional regulator
MKRRKALEIKKQILDLLKQKERSLRELETKVNTNYQTIRTQIKELEFLGFVTLVHHKKNKKNGKPFTTVKLKS